MPAIDPTKKAVPIGRVVTGNMDFQLSLEGSEAMWDAHGTPPVWSAHSPQAAERFHVELKLTDPRSKTRIPYANVSFKATNVDTDKTMTLLLPPMWGSRGLHYCCEQRPARRRHLCGDDNLRCADLPARTQGQGFVVLG